LYLPNFFGKLALVERIKNLEKITEAESSQFPALVRLLDLLADANSFQSCAEVGNSKISLRRERKCRFVARHKKWSWKLLSNASIPPDWSTDIFD